ncbi:MAG: hypothetical protein PHC51_01335 [bacterium]|nr:hypothetical protein [bacterium]
MDVSSKKFTERTGSLREKIVKVFEDDCQAHEDENAKKQIRALRSSPMATPDNIDSNNPLAGIFSSRANR